MATWLLAAKAIKDSGIKLKGDLLLMAVVGEIGARACRRIPASGIHREGSGHAVRHHARGSG